VSESPIAVGVAKPSAGVVPVVPPLGVPHPVPSALAYCPAQLPVAPPIVTEFVAPATRVLAAICFVVVMLPWLSTVKFGITSPEDELNVVVKSPTGKFITVIGVERSPVELV
jgi:hypothetical protein